MRFRKHPLRSFCLPAAVWCLAALLAASCGHGADGGPYGEFAYVVSTFPEPDATGVPVDVTVSATFDKEIDCSTLHFAVGSDKPEPTRPSTTECSGKTITRTFERNLWFDTTYHAVVGPTIDIDPDRQMEDEYRWYFTTEKTTTGWGNPEYVVEAGRDITMMTAAVDPAGNVMTLWRKEASSGIGSVYYLEADAAWAEYKYFVSPTRVVGSPGMEVDGSGNFWVAWDGTTGDDPLKPSDIHFSRFGAGTGTWSDPALVEDMSGNPDFSGIALDASGLPWVCWDHYDPDGPEDGHYISSYDGGAWSAPQRIVEDTRYATDLNLESDAQGNLFAAWSQEGVVWARRYDAASRLWSDPVPVSENPAEPGYAGYQALAVSRGGDAVVIWKQGDSTTSRIFANRYDSAGASWGMSTPIGEATPGAVLPRVVYAARERALAAWELEDNEVEHLWAAMFDIDTGWEEPFLMDDLSSRMLGFDLAADANGRFIVVWNQRIEDPFRFMVYVRRYEPGSGWTPTVHLDYGLDARIAMNDNYQAIVLWTKGNNWTLQREIFCCHYEK